MNSQNGSTGHIDGGHFMHAYVTYTIYIMAILPIS
jgi:hypothetical protein